MPMPVTTKDVQNLIEGNGAAFQGATINAFYGFGHYWRVKCFTQFAAHHGVRKRDLIDLRNEAAAAISNDWKLLCPDTTASGGSIFKEPHHAVLGWSKLSRRTIEMLMANEPATFPQASMGLVCLGLFASSKLGIDAYKELRLRPGIFSLSGFTETQVPILLEAGANSLNERNANVLKGMAAGHAMTKILAVQIKDALNTGEVQPVEHQISMDELLDYSWQGFSGGLARVKTKTGIKHSQFRTSVREKMPCIHL